jgi:broad specificity phosphatase PhoE
MASKLRRIVLLRHGETVGNSHERYHGSADVALSDEGRSQMRTAARQLAREVFELVVASPLQRSWQSAWIVAGGAPVRIEDGFREIHFGRWEGLTAEEIEARDPLAYSQWQAREPGFEFPAGERREDFRLRVVEGLARVEASGAANVLVVAHKGVARVIAEQLLGEPPSDGEPPLGGKLSLTRRGDRWQLGRRSSNPAALDGQAA